MKKFATLLFLGALFLLTAVNLVKADPSNPTINSFSIPETSSSSTVSVSISASSSAVITGYLLSESAEAPVLEDENWQGSAPTEYTFYSVNGTTLSTWEQKASSTNWHSITASADGLKLAAVQFFGGIHLSNDGGETWEEVDSVDYRYWADISSSADGSKIAASTQDYNIYISSDSGNTWTEVSTPAGKANHTSIAYSADGSTLITAVLNGYVYVSYDDGATWSTVLSDQVRNWFSVTTSADGSKLAAVLNGGYVYTSVDSGATWSERVESGVRSWKSIAYSADGSKLIASAPSGIYFSINDGANWEAYEFDVERNWGQVAISSNGNYLVAGAVGGYLYTSSNGGNTWVARNDDEGRDWGKLAITDKGNKIIASIIGSDYIYISNAGNSLYAWVKDNNDNISTLSTQSFSVALIDDSSPIITSFNVPESTDASGIEIELSAEDNNEVTKYLITETSEEPLLSDPNWTSINYSAIWELDSSNPPRTSTLYAWVTDGINISLPATSSISVDLLPTVDYFSIPASSTSLRVPVTINASDDGNIVGYKLTETASRPSAASSGWSTTVPTRYTFSSVKEVIPNSWEPSVGTNNDEDYNEWQAITSSADGNKLAAVVMYGGEGRNYVYTSTDAGTTWVKRLSSGARAWYDITSSSNGNKLAAVAMNYFDEVDEDGFSESHEDGYIYTSSNSGQTWTQRVSAGNRQWRAIASSDNGNKLAAVVEGGYIYTSTDSGKTWTARMTDESRDWYDITSSSNGDKLVAVAYDGYVYTSTNSGVTWTPRLTDEIRPWWRVTSSADGSRLVVASDGYLDDGYPKNHFYISSDSGVTWTPIVFNESIDIWTALDSSDNGLTLVAAGWNAHSESGYIYLSTDGGLNWTIQDIEKNWLSVAISADGKKIVAGTYQEAIYVAKMGNGLYAWVKDNAGQVSKIAKSSISAIDLSPVVMRASSESPNLEMSQDMIFVPTTINIDDENNQATLDLSMIASTSDSMVAVDVAQDITVNVSDKIKLEIFASTTISALDSYWQAILHLPQKKDASSVSLTSKDVLKVFEMGDPDRDLAFNKAARITLFGEANKLAGYKNASGEFYEINTICDADNQLTGDALPAGGDCKISVGDDLIIWTKHFSEYIVYAEGSSSSSNSNSLMIISSCLEVIYDTWQNTCIAGKQFRNILSKSPNNCSLTAAQIEASERTCGQTASVDLNQKDGDYQEEIKSVYNYEKSLVKSVNKKLSERLAGKILLQVEEKGQAWYVEPTSNRKYFMGRASDAFNLMRNLGLGISEKDFSNFQKTSAPARLSGRILLRVENNGEAYYINPVNLKMHYLGRPDDALKLMRELALGVSNENIRQIEVAEIE